jgi:hypothetical protein
MKNATKIPAAQELLAHAKTLGFANAQLRYADDDYDLYDTLGELADNYTAGATVSVAIHLILDDELTFTLHEDQDEFEPRIDYTE